MNECGLVELVEWWPGTWSVELVEYEKGKKDNLIVFIHSSVHLQPTCNFSILVTDKP